MGSTDLNHKLDNLSHKLLKWAKDRIGSVGKKIKETKVRLNHCLEAPYTPRSGEEISKLKILLEKLTYKEEIHWQ